MTSTSRYTRHLTIRLLNRDEHSATLESTRIRAIIVPVLVLHQRTRSTAHDLTVNDVGPRLRADRVAIVVRRVGTRHVNRLPRRTAIGHAVADIVPSRRTRLILTRARTVDVNLCSRRARISHSVAGVNASGRASRVPIRGAHINTRTRRAGYRLSRAIGVIARGRASRVPVRRTYINTRTRRAGDRLSRAIGVITRRRTSDISRRAGRSRSARTFF